MVARLPVPRHPTMQGFSDNTWAGVSEYLERGKRQPDVNENTNKLIHPGLPDFARH